MKIFIFGNTGAGKTTLANELNKFVQYEIISIDEMRKKYNDLSWNGEINSINKFIGSIKLDRTNQIIECSGVGKTGQRVRSLMSRIDDSMLIVVLKCDASVCSQRNEMKMWHELKIPQTKLETIQRRIKDFDVKDILDHFSTRYRVLLLDSTAEINLTGNVNLINSKLQ